MLSNHLDNEMDAVNISQTLTKCVEAAGFERTFQSVLKECLCDAPGGTPQLLVGEKQLLALATYAHCTDGILYGLPLILDINGENHLFLR